VIFSRTIRSDGNSMLAAKLRPLTWLVNAIKA